MRFPNRVQWVAACGALFACPSNDEDPNDDDDLAEGDADTDVDVDTDTDSPTTEGECGDESVPGYATSTDPSCVNTVATGTFDPVLEWSYDTWTTSPLSNLVLAAPVVASLTDDNSDGVINTEDIPDIVLVSFEGNIWGANPTLRALSGDGSGELWSSPPITIEYYGNPAAGDIDGDGIVEIVVVGSDLKIHAFENDGTDKWTSVAAPFNSWTHFSDAPAIADLDHDGNPEIIVGNTIWDHEGNLLGYGTHGYAQSSYYGSTPATADVDDDGVDDVLGGNAAYRMDGSEIWYNGKWTGFPVVADFDLDGELDIAVVGEGNVRIDDRFGNVLVPDVEIPGTGGANWGGPPVVADLDGDGAPEIGVASWDNFTVFDTDLTVLWTIPVDDSSSGITSATAFDFEGDGVAEVVYADEVSIKVLAGPTGDVRFTAVHGSLTWLEYPLVVDVDGDNHVEIVVVNHPGIMVYGDLNNSWVAGRKIWNEYNYHITNVNDDGTIPATEEPNWKTYNTFRSGDLTAGDELNAPDLNVTSSSVCEDECGQGHLVVWVQAANTGAVDVNVPVRYSVYAVDGGGLRTWIADGDGPTTLPVGTVADGSEILIEGFDPSSADSIVVHVDSDEAECDETNNEVEISGPFCVNSP